MLEEIVIAVLEYAGTVAFALSGALVAIRREMDLFGVCILGVVTAVGGGITRDVILRIVPGALLRPVYVLVAAASSLLFWLLMAHWKGKFPQKLEKLSDRVLLTVDAAGLGIFTGIGVLTGIHAGYGDNVFFLVFLGTLTGVGGGLLRDMMAQLRPNIFVRHIYALASIAGAVLCVILCRVSNEAAALLLSAALVFTIRMLAAHYRWSLPKLKISGS